MSSSEIKTLSEMMNRQVQISHELANRQDELEHELRITRHVVTTLANMIGMERTDLAALIEAAEIQAKRKQLEDIAS